MSYTGVVFLIYHHPIPILVKQHTTHKAKQPLPPPITIIILVVGTASALFFAKRASNRLRQTSTLLNNIKIKAIYSIIVTDTIKTITSGANEICGLRSTLM